MTAPATRCPPSSTVPIAKNASRTKVAEPLQLQVDVRLVVFIVRIIRESYYTNFGMSTLASTLVIRGTADPVHGGPRWTFTSWHARHHLRGLHRLPETPESLGSRSVDAGGVGGGDER